MNGIRTSIRMTTARTLCMLLFALMLAGIAQGYKPVRVPTSEDLATVWIGSSDHRLEYLRLELDKDGAGLLAVQYLPGEPARGYRVKRTTLAKYRVVFQLEPAEADADAVSLRGTAIPGRLDLELGGSNGNWKRKVSLEPLAKLAHRLDAVEKCVLRVRAKP